MIPIPALLPLLKNKYLIAGVIAALAVAAAWWWHSSRVQAAWEQGLKVGHESERAVWLVRENKELTEANELIAELSRRYRALEKKSASDVAEVAFEFQTMLKKVRHERDKALADARAGNAFRLRWAASCAPTRKDSGGDPTASAGSDPSRAVATTTCELPERTREDLIRLAGRADRVVHERNALLEIAKKDREVCK